MTYQQLNPSDPHRKPVLSFTAPAEKRHPPVDGTINKSRNPEPQPLGIFPDVVDKSPVPPDVEFRTSRVALVRTP